jgi:hypothetical protein
VTGRSLVKDYNLYRAGDPMPLLMATGDRKGLEGFAAGRYFDLFQWHDIGDMEMRQRRKVRIVWHL